MHVIQTVVIYKAQVRMLNAFLQSYNVKATNRIDATITMALLVLMSRHCGKFNPITHAKLVKTVN